MKKDPISQVFSAIGSDILSYIIFLGVLVLLIKSLF